ncbi:MAG: hypothetical protein AVDCRST_MAG15-1603 [uncultured Rubellimicrobium sp.]|uniref:DUF2007 domain-containing protein n=1 Tax=uncultured Rubellimicrobium sp. TaxID=543078 RepID=A0A6J4PA58_9RHOB|nr:MAG: hypothetical protein AVDCRST_MAG15-1603 [uncultured Rubellimicrobium sp.]
MATAVVTILPSLGEARRIARALAKARCPLAGRIEAVGSSGDRGQGGGIRLLVRCAPEALAEVERLIREHHTYAEPSIWTEAASPAAAPRAEEPIADLGTS